MRIWLDPKEEFTGFVDRLKEEYEEGHSSYPVTTYRGSFLELLMQLESEFDGVGNRALLIHMPGFNEDTIRDTPVFEQYMAGKRYRKALTTLVENTTDNCPETPNAQQYDADVNGVGLLCDANEQSETSQDYRQDLEQHMNGRFSNLSVGSVDLLPGAEKNWRAPHLNEFWVDPCGNAMICGQTSMRMPASSELEPSGSKPPRRETHSPREP